MLVRLFVASIVFASLSGAATVPGGSIRNSSVTVCLAAAGCSAGTQTNNAGNTVTLAGPYGAGTPASMQVNLLAQSLPGVLRARSTATVNVTGTPQLAYARSLATLLDWVKIDYGPLNGTVGNLWIGYDLEGTATQSGVASAFSQVTIQVGDTAAGSPYGQRRTVTHGTTSGSHVLSRSLPFIFGDWFPVYYFFSATAGSATPSPDGWLPGQVLGEGTGSAVFDSTFRFGRLTVTDAAGNVVAPSAVTSIGGVTYQVNAPNVCSVVLGSAHSGAVVPEGASIPVQLAATASTCPWTASSDSSWAQVFPLSGTGNAEVKLTVFPNFTTAPRTANVTIGGRTFSVYQSPNPRTSDQRFVELLYFNFFGRLPSAVDRDFQVNEGLKPPATRASLARNFLTSTEFNQGGRFVGGLYIGLLDRDAEYGGWLFQRNALSTGQVRSRDLVRNFITSQEYSLKFGSPGNEAFVTLLYQKILGRTPTLAEVAFQAAQLTDLESRVTMATNFLNSNEFRIGTDRRLTAFLLYATLLLRDPTPAEFDLRKSQIGSGVPLIDLIQSVVSSAEFQTVVN